MHDPVNRKVPSLEAAMPQLAIWYSANPLTFILIVRL
jgi:hypothetical protein